MRSRCSGVRHLLSLGSALAVVGLMVPETQAIIIRDDVPDAEYLVADVDYPALVTLFPPDDCAATLFTETHLLTAAHCAVDLIAGDGLDVNGTTHAVAEITLHPMWDDGDHYDIAVVRLEEAVVGVEPIPLYRGTEELGVEVTIVGRGVTGTGLEGEDGGSNDGMLRRATNVVSQVDEFLLEFVFESPAEGGITDLEGVGASGDSGGPVFLVENGTTYIAGINAFGDAPPGLGIGEYGSLDYQTRVSSFADWIDGVVDDGGPSSTGGEATDGGESGVDGSESDGPGTAGTDGMNGTSGTSSSTSSDSGSSAGSDTSDEGCGCSHGARSPIWALLVIPAGLRRRRRPAHRRTSAKR